MRPGDVGRDHAHGLVFDIQRPDLMRERDVLGEIEFGIDVEQLGDVMPLTVSSARRPGSTSCITPGARRRNGELTATKPLDRLAELVVDAAVPEVVAGAAADRVAAARNGWRCARAGEAAKLTQRDKGHRAIESQRVFHRSKLTYLSGTPSNAAATRRTE